MRAIAFGIAICAVCLTSTALAQSNLPLHVHMDMLLRQIETAVKAGNARDALGKIEQYRKLGMKMPPTLLFLEAKLAEIIKDYGHAEGALTEYLSLPEINADKNYAFALTLYPKIETKASEQAFENLTSLIHDARFRARSGHLLRLAVLRGRPASLAFVSPHSD